MKRNENGIESHTTAHKVAKLIKHLTRKNRDQVYCQYFDEKARKALANLGGTVPTLQQDDLVYKYSQPVQVGLKMKKIRSVVKYGSL